MRHGDLALSGRTYSVETPETRAERRHGLLGRTALARDAGMLFEQCLSVHTFRMRLPITVIALDREWRVVSVRRLAPNRLLLPRSRTRHILECAEGVSPRIGDRAELWLAGDELENEGAEQPPDDREDRRGGNDREGHDPADGARKRDGLAASFGGPEAEDLE
jgi:uncharacterized protein